MLNNEIEKRLGANQTKRIRLASVKSVHDNNINIRTSEKPIKQS